MPAEHSKESRITASRGPFASVIRKEIGRYLVFKGSVAVEGISLTIAGLADDYFEIAIIPENLGSH